MYSKEESSSETTPQTAMHTTGSAAHCRVNHTSMGRSVVPILKNTAVTLQKSNEDHRRWDGRIVHTTWQIYAQLIQLLVGKMLYWHWHHHFLFIVTSSANYLVFHVPPVVRDRGYIFLSVCCTRKLSVPETAGRSRKRMCDINCEQQY